MNQVPQLENGPLGVYVPSPWGNRFHSVADREAGELFLGEEGVVIAGDRDREDRAGINPDSKIWTADSRVYVKDLQPGDTVLDHAYKNWQVVEPVRCGSGVKLSVVRKKTITTILGAGAAGPGKSVVLLRDPLFQMMREMHRTRLPVEHPHWIAMGESVGYALFLRRTTPQVEDAWRTAKAVFPKWDPDIDTDAKNMTIFFSVGYRYQFGHCHDLDDWQRYMGVAKTQVDWDELITFEEDQFDNVNMWLRSSDPVLVHDLKVRGATNPVFTQPKNSSIVVKNPFWVRERFVEPHREGNKIIRKVINLEGETIERTQMYIPATLEDNPDANFRKSYKAQIAHRAPYIRRALIYGDWYATPGGYFEDVWDPDIHTCEPFAIPEHWPKWRAMDWGYKTHGVVGWFAADPDTNTFYLFREFTFRLMHDVDVAAQVRRIESEMDLWYRDKSLINGPADTQIWEQRGNAVVTIAEKFREKGIAWEYATKERIANGQAVARRLSDHDNRSKTPGLVLFKSCTETCNHFPNIMADQKVPEMPIKGGQDHWFDMVCYGVRFGDAKAWQDHEVMREIIDQGLAPGGNDEFGADGYGGY